MDLHTTLSEQRRHVLDCVAGLSRHAGHLDAARELIDGRQWLVLT